MPKTIHIYTDGACSGNQNETNIGGWGAVLEYGSHRKELFGGERDTTNNRMELMAAIEALEALKEPCYVRLHTDSTYLCNAFMQNWIANWQRNGWMTSAKHPVLNRDLWERLWQLSNKHHVTYIKVKGHSDNALNNRCDELARLAIKQNQ